MKSVCGKVGTFFIADHIQLLPKSFSPVSEEPLEIYIYSRKHKIKDMKLIHIKCQHNMEQRERSVNRWQAKWNTS